MDQRTIVRGGLALQQSWAAMILAACLLCASTPARGELIEFTFSGELVQTVGEVPASWDGTELGTPWSVRYVFDSETPDLALPEWGGRYDVISVTVTVDGVDQHSDDAYIGINASPLDPAEYKIRFDGLPIGATGKVSLLGPIGYFESDALPTELNLDDFGAGRLFQVTKEGGGWTFSGNAIDFSSQTVPAPAGLPVAVLAIVATSFCRRRTS